MLQRTKLQLTFINIRKKELFQRLYKCFNAPTTLRNTLEGRNSSLQFSGTKKGHAREKK